MTKRAGRFSPQIPMRVARVRGLSVVVPVVYAVGAAIELSGWGPVDGVLGFALMMLALLATLVALQGSGVHRIAHERVELLDEGERLIRDRVLAQSYRILATVFVIGVVYADIGMDLNRKFSWALPLPQTDFLVTTGAVILISLLLPSALLAWRLPVSEISADG